MGLGGTECESADVGHGWVLGLGIREGGAVGDRRDDRRYVNPPLPHTS